jgi:hypothetical protein
LAAYAAASGAVFAAAEAAQATVIYSGPQDIAIGTNQTYGLDLTGDGNPDFDFNQTSSADGGTLALQGNYCDDGVANTTTPGQPLPAGTDVESQSFYNTNPNGVGDLFPVTLATIGSDGTGSGPFYGVSDEYLAVLFFPDNQNTALYGWIELSVSGGADPTAGPTAVIEGWAYDDAGGDILTGQTTPEPTALALLALGASGVLMLRRSPKREPTGS